MKDDRQFARERHLALFIPARLAIRVAQLFNPEQPLTGFVSMM